MDEKCMEVRNRKRREEGFSVEMFVDGLCICENSWNVGIYQMRGKWFLEV